MERAWSHHELFARLHRQFRWRHPYWFDLKRYPEPTGRERAKIAKAKRKEWEAKQK